MKNSGVDVLSLKMRMKIRIKNKQAKACKNSGTDVPSLNLHGMKLPSDQMLQHLQAFEDHISTDC